MTSSPPLNKPRLVAEALISGDGRTSPDSGYIITLDPARQIAVHVGRSMEVDGDGGLSFELGVSEGVKNVSSWVLGELVTTIGPVSRAYATEVTMVTQELLRRENG